MALERTIYRERRDALDWLYRAFLRVEPQVPVERLRHAISGNDDRDRIPLAFPSAAEYAEFRGGLEQLFNVAGVTDATVQAIGSAVNGWRANPRKPLAAWSYGSDVDFAVFSIQALEQARQLGVPVNDGVILNNEYVVLKNEFENRGFYNTPLGRRLQDFARAWSELLNRPVDFKLNLRAEPFHTAVAVIQPVRS